MHSRGSTGAVLGLAIAVSLIVVLVAIDPWSRRQSESPPHPRSAPGGSFAATPSADDEQLIAAQAQRRIDDESEGRVAPVRVQAAPAVAAAGMPYPSPRPVPPDGFAFASAPVALDKAAYQPRTTPTRTPDAANDLHWLFPQADAAAIAHRQAQQVAASQRDRVFGWLRLADGADVGDLPGSGAHRIAVLGSAGRLVRVQLPTSEARLNALLDLEAVDGVGVMPPPRKVARGFLQEAQSRPYERHPVFVTLMAGDSDGRFGQALRALGAVVGRFDPDTRAYTANVDASSLDAIIAADFTLAVEPVGAYQAAHDTAVPSLGADAVRVHDGTAGLFAGTGGGSVPIAVMDTGLNTNHLDIATHRQSICAANFIHDASEDADLWMDEHGHGTHVTGTMVGNGFVEARYAGMAPAVAHVRFAKVLSRFGSGSSADIARGMDWLARPSACAAAGSGVAEVKPLIVNMSLALDSRYWRGRSYDERKLDAVAWAHRQLYVVANSNAGEYSFSDYAAAKNSLSVGATVDSGEVAGFSSRGPTFDGRLIPHVVAVGVDVYSAQGNGSRGNYVSFNGTSMASPATAGVAALLMDAVPEHREHPALARARLMAAAIKVDAWLDAASAFPASNSGGPGALQARYGLGKVSARTSVLQRDAPDGWTSGAASASMDEGSYGYREITVPEGAARLDVVMAWDEPPADTIGSAVLNDLDLYLDKDGDCLEAACGEHASLSRVDNVEWIIVRNPSPGTYRIKAVPRRIYTAAPRVGIAWQVVRGESTPSLRIAVDEVRGHEVALTVTTDSYVAAGVRLYATCQYASGEWCNSSINVRDVESEDGVVRPTTGYVSGVELGEIGVGEQQQVVLDFVDLGDQPARLYFGANGWNARPAIASVALPGADAGAADPPAEATPPANDDFADAATLDAGGGSVELDLQQATFEPGEPPYRGARSRPMGSLWYEWTAPASAPTRFGIYRNEASGGGTAYLDVFVGDHVAGLELLISRKWGGSIFAEEGVAYRIRVSVSAGGELTAAAQGVGAATLHWAQGPRPDNDDFATATALEGAEGEISGSNFGATLEPGERVGALAATVWYRWSAPEDGYWRISAEGTFVLVFVGDEVASLRLVSGGTIDSALVPVKAGVSYHFAVAAEDALEAGRRFTLQWTRQSERDVGNDDFANAEALEGEEGTHWLPTGESVEPDEPVQSGVRTRWWVWQAPSSGRFTWRLGDRLRLAVFAAEGLENESATTTLAALRPAAVGDRALRELTFDAVEGTRYWISVGYDLGEPDSIAAGGGASVAWGRTPANDDIATAATIADSSGSSTVLAIYGTVEHGERSGALGRSSLWWEITPTSAGWMRFWIEDGHTATLAVYLPDGDGGLQLLAKSVGNWRSPDAPWDLAEVRFSAVEGQRYLVRLGLLSLQAPELKLRWQETEAPTWLRYAGTLKADALELGNVSSPTLKMAFEDRGEALYIASPNGLHVLQRDANSGALTPSGTPIAQLDGVSLADANALLWDPRREKLYINLQDCAWRRLAPADDSRLVLQDDGEILAVDESSDCDDVDWALLHATSSFVYFERDGDIALLDFGDDGRLPSETTQYAPEQAISSAVLTKDSYLYAAEGDTLRVFATDAETGALTLAELADVSLYNTPTAIAIGGEDRFLFAITRGGDADVYRRTMPTEFEHVETLWSFSNAMLGGSCELASARADGKALDAFCRNSAFVVALRGEAEEARPQAADYLANWRPDRFNNHIPKFPSPSELLASPDGKHAYLFDKGTGAILHFERVGNNLPEADEEPGDTAQGRGEPSSDSHER